MALATFHSAKGLEYEEVYIIDVNEKVVPYKKAVLEEDIERGAAHVLRGDDESEKQGSICYWVDMLNNHEMEPSRFLQEMGENT